MELFKLFGTIAINNKDANKSIDETSGKAEGANSKIGGAFGKVGSAALKVGKVVGAGMVAAGAAIAKVSKASVEQYSQYEQLTGGVQTLFGSGGKSLKDYAASVGKTVAQSKDKYDQLMKAQNLVMQNSTTAYKTAGMSANEYMDTITSFSASLIQSVGGDTVKAAKAGNMAVTDMSDNANKMGTNISSIQYAYSGFAKQNYTMLDNLKLGYGGTQKEMQRLLADAQKISGQKYDMSSFNDVVSAIHVVQTQMGITGTTAREAATTIEGSTNMVKASWKNLLTGMADQNQDVSKLVENLGDSVGTLAKNLVPRIQQTLKGISEAVTKVAPKIMTAVQDIFSKVMPNMVKAASTLFLTLVKTIVALIPSLSRAVIKQLPVFIRGLTQVFAGIVKALPKLIKSIANALPGLAPVLVTGAVQMIVTLVKYLPQIIAPIIESIPKIMGSIFDAVGSSLPTLMSGASGPILGLFAAFKGTSAIFNAVKGFQEAKVAISLLTMEVGKANIAQKVLDGTLTIGETIVGIFTGKIKLAAIAQGLLAKGQAALNIVMDANPIMLIVIAIAALVTGFILLWNHCKGFRDFWINLWKILQGAFQSFLSFISPAIDAIKGFFAALGKKIEEVWGSITKSLKPVVDSMVNAFRQGWELIKAVWRLVEPFFKAIASGIKAAFSGVKAFLETVFRGAWTVIKAVWSFAIPFFEGVWNGIKAVFGVVAVFFKGAFGTAFTVVKAVWNTATGFFRAIWNTIAGIFKVVPLVLGGDFKGAWKAIKGIVNTWKGYFSGVWNSIKSIFGSVAHWFGSTFGAAWSAIKGVFSGWGSFFSGLWSRISSTFSSIGTKISGAIGGAVKSGINGIISRMQSVVNGAVGIINGAIGLINKLPGVSVGKVGKVSFPRLATGTIVDKATIAEIGEDGKEAVMPLEKNTGWIKKLAGDITELQGGSTANSDAITKKLDELLEAIANLKIYLNTGELVGGIAGKIDESLGNKNRLRARGG